MNRLLISLAATALSLGATAQNYTIPHIENYVEVTGTSEITLKPDLFFLKITLDEGDSKVKIVFKSQEKQLISKLKEIGINTNEQLKIENLVSQYEKRNNTKTRANYILELTTEEQIAEVYEVLDDLDISQAYIMRTESTSINEARTIARKEAMLNARTAAEELAKTLGQEVGNCFYIHDHSNDYTPSNNNYEYRPLYARNTTMQQETDSNNSTILEVKEIKYTYRVDTKFYLE